MDFPSPQARGWQAVLNGSSHGAAMLERTPCGVPQLRQKVGNKVQGRRSRRLDPFPEPASAPPSANALHPQTTSHQPPGQTRLRPVVRAEEPEGPSNEDLPGQLPQAHGVSKPTIGSSAAPPFLADTHHCQATRRQRLAICVRRGTTTQGRRSRHLGRCPFACLDLLTQWLRPGRNCHTANPEHRFVAQRHCNGGPPSARWPGAWLPLHSPGGHPGRGPREVKRSRGCGSVKRRKRTRHKPKHTGQPTRKTPRATRNKVSTTSHWLDRPCKGRQ